MKNKLIAAALALAAGHANAGNVLVVLSDADRLQLQDGKTLKTGFFLNELMQPVQEFVRQGHTVVFATPKGRAPTADPKSDDVQFFGGDQAAHASAKALLATLKLTSAKDAPVISLAKVAALGYDKFDAVFVPGGHAPMQDLLKDRDLGKLLQHFHAKGKPTGLTCHGTIALLAALPDAGGYVKMLESGQRASPAAAWIYSGYRMTVFSNEEEQQSAAFLEGGRMKLYPQDGLEAAGAKFVGGKAWAPNVIEDRELITGQNPQSALAVAQAMGRRL